MNSTKLIRAGAILALFIITQASDGASFSGAEINRSASTSSAVRFPPLPPTPLTPTSPSTETPGYWDDRFGLPPGVDGDISCFVSYGGRVYVGGRFHTVGTNKIDGIACWDGSKWSALGDGIDGYVKAMVVHDGALYVGGSFNTRGSVTATNLAMWRRGRWHQVGGGVPSTYRSVQSQEVKCLVSSGRDLFVGGEFTQVGNILALNVAKWDGRKWSALGQGVGYKFENYDNVFSAFGWVESLAVVNKRLYAGGVFDRAGGVPAQSIACWDGRKWSNVGGGMSDGSLERWTTANGGEISGMVFTLASYGPYLLAGGSFTKAGSIQATNVAFWNGKRWSQLGGGVRQSKESGLGVARQIYVRGGSIYVGGFFQWAGGTPAANVARFHRRRWTALGEGVAGIVGAFVSKGSTVMVGGEFGLAGSEHVASIAQWDRGAWSSIGPPIGTVFTNALFGDVQSIVVDGENAYAGGYFYSAGNLRGPLSLVKWDGEKWSSPGGGITNEYIYRVAASGGKVFVAGRFVLPQAGATNFAMWDGTNWSALGSGLQSTDATGAVYSGSVELMAATTNKLFVAGYFNRAGGVNATNLAMWDGTNWHAVGDAMWLSDDPYSFTGPGRITSMAVSGSDLYVAGAFNRIGSVSATNLARWDGNTWFPLGDGLERDFYQSHFIQALTVIGTNVCIGGGFNIAGNPGTTNIAVWNGTSWSALGNPFRDRDRIPFLTSTERNLYAAGYFTNAAGKAANQIARWDGSDWWPLGDGLSSLSIVAWVQAMSAGEGKVYVGGRFTEAGGLSSSLFALWHEPRPVVSIPRVLPPRLIRLPPVPGGVPPPIAR